MQGHSKPATQEPETDSRDKFFFMQGIAAANRLGTNCFYNDPEGVEAAFEYTQVLHKADIDKRLYPPAKPQPTTNAAESVVALQQKLEQASVRETMLTREKDELRKQRDALKKQLREQFFAFAEGLAKWKKELDEEGAAT